MDSGPEITSVPAKAQRAEDVSLPIDAAERKRVLNILAQRRYRETFKMILANFCNDIVRTSSKRATSSP